MTLGYAHGLAGALDAVLCWNPDPPPVVPALLDELLLHARVEGDLAAWPVSVGEEVGGLFWPSWCNGMAGHVYLWCHAFEVFQDERYLRAARLAADTTSVIYPQNASVCCGTAGQALALNRFFRLTNEQRYRRLAVQRAERACAQALASGGYTLGYFTGLSGIAQLAYAMHSRQTPYLPLIDVPS